MSQLSGADYGTFRTLFWGPYSKDDTVYGTIFGSPIFGNPHKELWALNFADKPLSRSSEEPKNREELRAEALRLVLECRVRCRVSGCLGFRVLGFRVLGL